MADATAVTAGLVAAGAIAAAAGWAVVYVRGPGYALRAARRALDRGDYAAALALVRRHRPAPNAPSKPWHAEQWQLESECLYAAAEAALRDRRFAEALEHYRAVAALVGLSEADASRRVVEAMLAEARRLSAADPEATALPELLGLILERQSPCPEASFWLGLYHLRRGDAAAAVTALEAAHAGTQGRQADAALYLGAVYLRGGKPRDALRVLAEANRLAPHCPLVAWQLGVALTESGGDALLALRAFQKTTAADGLPKYVRHPSRLWAETLPADSWVRNLAQRAGTQRATFVCPLGMDKVAEVLQQTRVALAETLVTCDRAEEALPVFAELLKGGDHLPARRGLGLALARLGRYDDALPHLKKAQAAEKPPSAVTTGALAACLAHAGGDRGANVRRALGLIASLNVRADAVWARHAGAVFAAAQAAGVAVSADEVAELANILTSTNAADPTAAEIYDLLAALRPEAVPADAARLYVRAAQRHGVRRAHDEQLFAAAMADRAATRAFFTAHEWDFDAAERLYLERWAERHPGTFPTAPGRDYPAVAETALLADARRLAGQNRPGNARDVAKLVLKLRPTSGPAHDLLAELAYRRGDKSEAVNWLKTWHGHSPADPRPLARLAAVAAADNRHAAALAMARQSLDRARGPARLPYLLLAARLALAAGKSSDTVTVLDECLRLAPSHPTALAGRAALAWASDDFATLSRLAERMAAVAAEDPWYHYLTGAAALLAGHLDTAEVSARHAATEPTTAAEGRHLLALIRDRRHDTAGAAELLKDPSVASGAAADHAFALRGQAAWRGGDYAEALRCWQALPRERLKTWNLAPLLGGTAFMAGAQALRAGDAAEAAKWLRQAAKLGHADPRLGALLAAASGHSVELLEQAIEAGGPRPAVVGRLAREYRRAGRLADARRLLDRAAADEPTLALERGLLLLAEGYLTPAEKAFAAARAHDPKSAAACINLAFTRLSLGRVAEAAELLPRAAELAPTPVQQRLLTQLHLLAAGVAEAPAGWSVEDDRAVVQCLRSLGRLEAIEQLFDALATVRGQSPVVRQAAAELLPLRGKDRLDRGDPAAARELLEGPAGSHPPVLVRNLLGVAASLQQDFGRAVRQFQAALPKVGDDARMQQNLALVRGWMGDAERSAAHWRRFLELHAGQTSKPPGV
ncbi:MAG TPA: tetratricopeptide repeat protein, partial [Gemmataceae bacterium]